MNFYHNVNIRRRDIGGYWDYTGEKSYIGTCYTATVY